MVKEGLRSLPWSLCPAASQGVSEGLKPTILGMESPRGPLSMSMVTRHSHPPGEEFVSHLQRAHGSGGFASGPMASTEQAWDLDPI